MESASNPLKPVTRGIGVYDGGEAVTDVKTVSFESASGSLDKGKHRVTLTWKDADWSTKANVFVRNYTTRQDAS
jgi:hypothetical protein